MKIGYCIGTNVERVKQLSQFGYDCYEPAFSGIAEMDEKEFASFRRETEKYGIPCLSCNGMLPGTLSPFREQDYGEMKAFLERGMERMSALGGEVAVLGSGTSRNIPEGYDRELARRQFVDLVKMCADLAQKRNIRIAIEPLARQETNFIHTLEDGVGICQDAGRENVGVTADFYHMYMNADDFSHLETYSSSIFHLHIARFNPDRGIPGPADVEAFRPIAETLGKIGYKGILNVEGRRTGSAEEAMKNFLPVAELFRGYING